MSANYLLQAAGVHCRTGSLEILNIERINDDMVHCRTGSLEIFLRIFLI
ncbi:hypothetical protein VC116063_003791 [Vibrio cholerae O1 str. 116063]|nr:hypothetical protein VC116063_003791 [Vibrio cholerae O1 str. 116063]KFE15563.1 hypothetical protein DN38_2495 [Vibrio cholerae]